MARIHTAIGIAALAVIVFASSPPVTAQIVNNEANAKLLANRAKSLLKKSDRTDEQRKSERLQRQGSPVATIAPDAECGGVAIGNVRPVPGDHRSHDTTIIVLGDIINTNNRC